MADTSKPIPGAADFDPQAPGVSAADLQEHLAILTARQQIADLTAPAATSGFGGYTPAPDDIKAVKNGETRYFSQLTWEAMETKGKHDGWEEYVEKPADKKK